MATQACRRIALGTLSELLIDPADLTEQRPSGIFCRPDTSKLTIENEEITFNNVHLLCVNIEMEANDFEKMRYESRFGPDTKNEGPRIVSMLLETLGQCDVPWPDRFNWYVANINIDGIYLGNVGIRKKGFLGSIFSPAPSLKIQTNRFTNQAFNKIINITLNNNAEDASRIKSALNYKVFEWASYNSPRCNLANVSINKNPFGIYSHLEAIDESFLLLNYGSTEGHLYEGQLTDFVTDWLPRWEAETDKTDLLKQPIYNISNALNSSDKDLLENLSKYLDINLFIKFWALEILLDHTDGYCTNRNNFYVYFNPNNKGKAVFIPWGMNYFQGFTPTDSTNTSNGLQPYIKARIPQRLSRNPAIARQLINELQRLLNHVWNEEKLIELIETYETQVRTSQRNANYNAEVDALKKWVLERRILVQQMINEGLPEGNLNVSCF